MCNHKYCEIILPEKKKVKNLNDIFIKHSSQNKAEFKIVQPATEHFK